MNPRGTGRPTADALRGGMPGIAAGLLLALVSFAAPAAFLSVAATLPSVAAAPAATQSPAPAERGPHDATARHPFDDVERWVRVFDDPGRDAWQRPSLVVEALRLRPGMVVADLGAGTGYFLPYLAKALRPGGIILAIDPQPEMVRHLAERTHEAKIAGVVPVLALPDDPFLPEGRVDRVLIVDTYHHIDDRTGYFRRMRRALAPGGRVVVVDFHKKPLPVGPPPEHKLERDFVVKEMTLSGYDLADEKDFLPYQYLLVFAPIPPAEPHP